jgi:hypothetical protein
VLTFRRAQTFNGLVSDGAIRGLGCYWDNFFDQVDPAAGPQARDESEGIRKLRSLIWNLIDIFQRIITVKGESQTIVAPEDNFSIIDSNSECLRGLHSVLRAWLKLYSVPESTDIPLDALVSMHVDNVMGVTHRFVRSPIARPLTLSVRHRLALSAKY